MELLNFDYIGLDALQSLQDIFPDGWFDDVVQDLDSGTCYCLKCKNNWIE